MRLHIALLYANDAVHGVGAYEYWLHISANHAQVTVKMHEYTTTANTTLECQMPFEVLVSRACPGAYFANFDVGQLIHINIYDDPT